MLRSQVVTLSSKGQMVLPRAIRTAAGLHSGSTLSISLEADGTISIRPVRGTLAGFFQALDGPQASACLDADGLILQTVEDLDNAARRR